MKTFNLNVLKCLMLIMTGTSLMTPLTSLAKGNSVSAKEYYKNNPQPPVNSYQAGSNGHSYRTNSLSDSIHNDKDMTECIQAFKALFPQEDQKKYENACIRYDVQRSIIGRSQWGVKKSDYIQCLNINRTLKNTEEAYIEDCASDYKAIEMLKPDYTKCFATITREFGIRAAYQNCQDRQFLYEYKTDDFAQCRVRLGELSQSPSTILSKCKDFVDRSRIVSKGFSKCQSYLQSLKTDVNTTLKFCSQDKILSNMGKREYSACQDSVSQMTSNPYVTIALCSNSDALDAVEQNPRCVEKSIRSTFKNYIPYVAFSTNDYMTDKNYFYYLAKDCRYSNREQNAVQNASLRLLKDINIHTQENLSFPDKNKAHVQVGGISALSYDKQTQTLYMLSDETKLATQLPPRLYTYSLNDRLELRDSKIMSFSFGSSQEPDIDPEGLVRLNDGRFIVSSEVGKNKTEHFNDEVVNITNINIFDAQGLYTGSISLPESFKTKYEAYKAKSSKSKSSSKKSVNYGIPDYSNTNYSSDDNQQTITYSRLVSGLEFNKSLESISVSPDESSLFIANESSLIQDRNLKGKCPSRHSHHDSDSSDENTKDKNNGKRKSYSDYNDYQSCGKVVRLARYIRNDKLKQPYLPVEEFKYELEPEIDNGIAEILALDNRTILTLERSWDNIKQKVTSRLYKVELKSGSIIPANATEANINVIEPLEKKLILDLDQIIPQLSPGFRVLDNFEGMAFGPVLPNGNKTLLVISDNNFSKRQRTVLLIFEILPHSTVK